LLPVISAAADARDASMMPQQIYIGTPPGAACKGTVFKEMHDKAHSADKGGTWWMEWALVADDLGKTIQSTAQAVEAAYDTNPALGYRIAEKTVINEFENMSLDGFARERLGWWAPISEQKQEYAIPVAVWDACKSTAGKPNGKTAYGVKFSLDGSMVCLCGAVVPDNGIARISLIDIRSTGQGVNWLAEWLNERYSQACCVYIDGKNGVDVLIDKISHVWRMKDAVVKPSARDVIAAVSTLTDCLNEQTVTWFCKQETLRDSAITAVKRPIAGGWGFGGDNSIPIEAAALALYGAKTSKRDPAKRMRIG